MLNAGNNAASGSRDKMDRINRRVGKVNPDGHVELWLVQTAYIPHHILHHIAGMQN